MSAGDQRTSVKERTDPVPCVECGRTTWSSHSLCVYCRLGWPDPGDLRGLLPDCVSVGTLRLSQEAVAVKGAAPQQQRLLRSRDGQLLQLVATDANGRFDEDVPCVKCKYLLRGMRLEDACPECGEPVERSLRLTDLQAADPKWLRSLSTGAAFLFAGLLMIALSPFMLFALGLGAMLVFLAGTALVTIGVWNVTVHQRRFKPRYEVSGINERIAWWARVSSPALLLMVPLQFLAWNTPIAWWLAAPMAVLLTVLIAICGTMTMLLLGNYANQLNDDGLATSCNIAAAMIAVLIGWLLALAWTGAVASSALSGMAFSLLTCVLALQIPLGMFLLIVTGVAAARLNRAAATSEAFWSRASAATLEPGQQGRQDQQ